MRSSNLCLIISEAKPLPPGEFTLSNKPLIDPSLSILLRVFEKFSLEIAPSAYSPSIISPEATKTANLLSEEFSLFKSARLSLKDIIFSSTSEDR